MQTGHQIHPATMYALKDSAATKEKEFMIIFKKIFGCYRKTDAIIIVSFGTANIVAPSFLSPSKFFDLVLSKMSFMHDEVLAKLATVMSWILKTPMKNLQLAALLMVYILVFRFPCVT